MGFWGGSRIIWTICKQSVPRSRQITTPTPHHSIFTGRMLFLTTGQRHQGTEGVPRNTKCGLLLQLYVVNDLLSVSMCPSAGYNMSCSKTAEPTEMPFWIWTRVGPRSRVFGGGSDPRKCGDIRGRPCAAAFR